MKISLRLGVLLLALIVLMMVNTHKAEAAGSAQCDLNSTAPTEQGIRNMPVPDWVKSCVQGSVNTFNPATIGFLYTDLDGQTLQANSTVDATIYYGVYVRRLCSNDKNITISSIPNGMQQIGGSTSHTFNVGGSCNTGVVYSSLRVRLNTNLFPTSGTYTFRFNYSLTADGQTASGATDLHVSVNINQGVPTAGTIYISKYGPGHPNPDGNFLNNTPEVNNILTSTNTYQGGPFTGHNQPNRLNPNVDRQLSYQGAGSFYTVRFSVPPGYRLTKVSTLNNQGRQPRGAACSGAFSTGDCSLDIILTTNDNFRYVDLFFDYTDIPPIGNLENLSCTPEDPITASGWALDMSKPDASIQVARYIGNESGPSRQLSDVTTSLFRPDVNAAIIPPTKNVAISGNHGFTFEIPDEYKDGAVHYLYTYALGIDTLGIKDKINPPIGIRAFQCNARPTFYPWLQTKNGDVTAVDKIIGQFFDLPNSPEGPHPGGRSNPNIGELDYALVSSFGDNNQTSHFCTLNYYVLGGVAVGEPNKHCSAGNYDFTRVDIDRIRAAVDDSYRRNGNGAGTTCTPYKTVNVNSVATKISTVASDCPEGTIYRASVQSSFNSKLSDILATTSITKGRATIYVPGNLIIDQDLTYSYVGGYVSPQELPNIGIYVNGIVTILPGVGQVDASIVAKEQIRSCSDYPSATCRNRLIVHGYWASANGFQFGRNYFVNGSESNNNPAEQIILTGQSVAFPPPGFSRSDGDINSGLQIDGAELPPRLN